MSISFSEQRNFFRSFTNNYLTSSSHPDTLASSRYVQKLLGRIFATCA
jgi:hypothetical protein